MRITRINIPKSINNNDGLEQIKMDKLDKIVLIAGKNGSGKTRIINKIFNKLNSKPKKNIINSLSQQLETNKNTLANNEKTIANLKEQLSKNPNQILINSINERIDILNRSSSSIIENISKLEVKLNWNEIETNELSESYTSIRFVPKSLELRDCNSFPKNEIINYAKNINTVGMQNLPNGTFAKIQVIQDRWFNSTHQHSQASEIEKESAIADYEKLKQLIELFLNTSLGRTLNDEATLFGFPMGKSNLSDGQKILLQFCLAIYSQETALKDLILILDEPENHLHPSVIIETIERIQKL